MGIHSQPMNDSTENTKSWGKGILYIGGQKRVHTVYSVSKSSILSISTYFQ